MRATIVAMAACIAIALSLLTPEIVLANKKGPALPTAVLAARTIYIDNQTTDASLQNSVYMGLAKWGHLQVVDSAQKADIVLRLTGTSFVSSVPSDTPPDMSVSAKPRASSATGAPSPASPNQAANGGGPPATPAGFLPNGYEPAPDGFTRLTLLETKTGSAVWSDLSKTNTPQAAAHIIDGLREAFEQGQKTRDK